MGLWWAIAGLGVTSASSLHYLALIPREAVPERPWGHRLGLALGAVLAVSGAVLDPAAPVLAVAVLTGVIAALHLHTLASHDLPPITPAVAVGEPLPAVTVLDEQGDAVSSTSWQGQWLLLKVFRGHW